MSCFASGDVPSDDIICVDMSEVCRLDDLSVPHTSFLRNVLE